jgi:hypothetical protein
MSIASIAKAAKKSKIVRANQQLKALPKRPVTFRTNLIIGLAYHFYIGLK